VEELSSKARSSWEDTVIDYGRGLTTDCQLFTSIESLGIGANITIKQGTPCSWADACNTYLQTLTLLPVTHGLSNVASEYGNPTCGDEKDNARGQKKCQIDLK
jgi:hypothetical protein